MTGEDVDVDWNQIEGKWAAMTRRVRADWHDATSSPLRDGSEENEVQVDVAPKFLVNPQVRSADVLQKLTTERAWDRR
jgi:hypothetical protein